MILFHSFIYPFIHSVIYWNIYQISIHFINVIQIIIFIYLFIFRTDSLNLHHGVHEILFLYDNFFSIYPSICHYTATTPMNIH